MKKICTKCKQEKNLKEFSTDRRAKDQHCSLCKECGRKKDRKYRKKFIWNVLLSDIKQRCNNKNNKRYHRYGGRGIKCLITVEELKELWFRDKAYLMKKPSIDREDNDGNYIFSNCKFMELVDNMKKAHMKTVVQFDLQGNFIQEYVSLTEASRKNSIWHQNISKCCRGIYKKSGGYKWRFK